MSINTVTLKGRLGDHPANNNGVVKFPLATDDGYTNNQGQKVEKTNWHSIVAFGKTGEVIEKYVSKGDEIVVIGKIEYSEHEGKYYTQIKVREFDFVSNKKQ